MDVIKKEKTPKQAAALKFEPGKDNVPVIVGLGKGYVAENILKTADEYDIPIVPDSNLANILCKLSVGDQIPPELYEVVAQILVYVSNMDQLFGNVLLKS